jgi:hypothetical protein
MQYTYLILNTADGRGRRKNFKLASLSGGTPKLLVILHLVINCNHLLAGKAGLDAIFLQKLRGSSRFEEVWAMTFL